MKKFIITHLIFLAAAFGMPVAAFDPAAPDVPGIARATTLQELLARSDVLSLHVPLLPATRHLIGAAELAALPPGAMVLNTARGGLIDEAALHGALESGRLAGAGRPAHRIGGQDAESSSV